MFATLAEKSSTGDTLGDAFIFDNRLLNISRIYEGQTFLYKLRYQLRKRCSPYHLPWTQAVDTELKNELVSLVKWKPFGYDSSRITLYKFLVASSHENYADIILFAMGNDDSLEPKYAFYRIFRFNYYYKYLIIPMNATLDSRLHLIKFKNIVSNLTEYDIETNKQSVSPISTVLQNNLSLFFFVKNLTLRKLFGCRPPKKTKFNASARFAIIPQILYQFSV